MKWFNYIELIGFILLVISFINILMTDYTAGILIYKGFLPLSLIVPILIISLIMIIVGYFIELIDMFKEKK